MPRHYFSPRLHQSAAPFSHYAEHGNTGYTAGIIGQRPDTGELVSDDVSQQCDAMLTNLQTLLGEQRLTLNDLLRTTVYLTDYRDFAAINDVYAKRLNEPYPVRTTVQVAALPLGAKVQIESVVAAS
jgi:2-iminobutanoate/2-iminopropanoate deaminase